MFTKIFAGGAERPDMKSPMSKLPLAALAAFLFVAVSQFAPASPAFAQSAPGTSESDCFLKNGTDCVDDDTLPTTGQFHDLSDRKNADGSTPTSPVSQHHANVRLTQDTFVYAHNICRWVGNDTTKGRSVFIGLETKNEWVSFINNQPAGSAIEHCCQPVTVSVCGTSKTIGFGKAGTNAGPYSAGYNFKTTYRCTAGNVSGAGATADTSWIATTSGSCAAPAPTCTRVWEQNDRGGAGHWVETCSGGSSGGSNDDGNEKGKDGGTQSDRDGGSSGSGGTGGQP